MNIEQHVREGHQPFSSTFMFMSHNNTFATLICVFLASTRLKGRLYLVDNLSVYMPQNRLYSLFLDTCSSHFYATPMPCSAAMGAFILVYACSTRDCLLRLVPRVSIIQLKTRHSSRHIT